MTNEELVKLIQSGDDVQGNLEKLWLQNTGIVHRLAVSYARNDFEVEDLEQEGYFALVKAAEKYDPECGAKFITYFVIHLNARMRRYLAKTRSTIKIPVHLADDVVKYDKAKKKLQMELKAEPSDQMISAVMGISLDKLEKIKKAAKDMDARSLDEIRDDDDENMQSKIPDPNDKIAGLIDDIAARQLSDHLWSMVDKLNEREQEIIKEIYLQDRTCADIAREAGVTRSAIDGVKRRALNKLERQPGSYQLKMMARDIYGIALQGSGLATFQQTWTSSTERAAIRDLELSERASKRRDIDYE